MQCLRICVLKHKFSGHFTNHSLKTYGTTTLYCANLSEKLIQERTGRWCFKALGQYEWTSNSQLVEVSNIINSNKVQALAMSSVSCNEPKMEICKQDKVVSQKSNEMIIPMQQSFLHTLLHVGAYNLKCHNMHCLHRSS